MNPTEITAWGGLVLLVVTGIIVPRWLAKRAEKLAEGKQALDAAKEGGEVAVLNWTNFTQALQRERDDLRKQLDEIEARHRQQLKDVETDWEQRNQLLKLRIVDLETDVGSLQRQLTVALQGRGGSASGN